MASVSATERIVAVNRGIREKEGMKRNRRESENHGPAEVRVSPIYTRIYTEVAPAIPHRRRHHHRHDHHTTSTTTTNTATATDVEALHLSHSFRHFFARPSPTSVTYIFRGAASVCAHLRFQHDGSSPGQNRVNATNPLFTRLPMSSVNLTYHILLSVSFCC